MIGGNFRCCVYKEREIIRQRIRVAEGRSPIQDKENRNIVQVVESACEGCPINRYVVTDNCQRCSTGQLRLHGRIKSAIAL